jgi:hypothetical protein
VSQVALAVPVDRVDDHRVRAAGGRQDIGEGGGFAVEQLDGMDVHGAE